MACCDTQKNIGTYRGVTGPIPFCKKCGKSGKSIPASTAEAALASVKDDA